MMSPSIVLAASLQFLIATLFLVIGTVVLRRGAHAQRAAEAAVARQGFQPGVLVQHQVRFDESGSEAVLPFAIAVGLAALALLNLSGYELGRVLSWILQPILLVVGGLVTTGQLFARRSIFDRIPTVGRRAAARHRCERNCRRRHGRLSPLASAPHRRTLRTG